MKTTPDPDDYRMTSVAVDRQLLIDAYNQVQRTQLAVNAAVRTLENASRTLRDAQGEADTALSALVLILKEVLP